MQIPKKQTGINKVFKYFLNQKFQLLKRPKVKNMMANALFVRKRDMGIRIAKRSVVNVVKLGMDLKIVRKVIVLRKVVLNDLDYYCRIYIYISISLYTYITILLYDYMTI